MTQGDKRSQPSQPDEDDEFAELRGTERRRAQRVLVNIEVDYADEDTYLLANITDISATGIFVRTTTPAVVGTRLGLRFSPSGAEAPFELEGQVMWINPHRPGTHGSIHPGMGIRFVELSLSDQLRLESLVRRIAYLG